MVASRDELLRKITAVAPELRALGVQRLGVFGSYARAEAHTGSDLDVLVSLEPRSFDSYMNVKILLEDRLGLTVDLVLDSALKPRLRQPILRELVNAPGF